MRIVIFFFRLHFVFFISFPIGIGVYFFLSFLFSLCFFLPSLCSPFAHVPKSTKDQNSGCIAIAFALVIFPHQPSDQTNSGDRYRDTIKMHDAILRLGAAGARVHDVKHLHMLIYWTNVSSNENRLQMGYFCSVLCVFVARTYCHEKFIFIACKGL